ncbi:bola protein, partial [Entophlyctis helioformis]
MPVSKAALEALFAAKLQPTHLQVTDTSDGCGQSYDVIVVSELFAGKSLLQRHRLVNDAAKDEIAQIHAFSQKSYTPDQWAQIQQREASQQ